jgi:hypothetical protein
MSFGAAAARQRGAGANAELERRMVASHVEPRAGQRKDCTWRPGRKAFTPTIEGFAVALAYPTAPRAQVPDAVYNVGTGLNPALLPSGRIGDLIQSHVGTTPADLYGTGRNPDPDYPPGEEYDYQAFATSFLTLHAGGDLWAPFGGASTGGGTRTWSTTRRFPGPPAFRCL